MRRLLLAAFFALLAVPTAFGAISGAAAEDGTLSIRDAKGVIELKVTGSVLGRFDNGEIEILDRNPDDTKEPQVRGAERTRVVSERKTIWYGKKVRFRIVGGRFPATIRAVGIDLSVVGRGTVIVNAYDRHWADPGEYSLNLEDYQPIPLEKKTLRVESD